MFDDSSLSTKPPEPSGGKQLSETSKQIKQLMKFPTGRK
jgi:hypothetical protein